MRVLRAFGDASLRTNVSRSRMQYPASPPLAARGGSRSTTARRALRRGRGRNRSVLVTEAPLLSGQLRRDGQPLARVPDAGAVRRSSRASRGRGPVGGRDRRRGLDRRRADVHVRPPRRARDSTLDWPSTIRRRRRRSTQPAAMAAAELIYGLRVPARSERALRPGPCPPTGPSKGSRSSPPSSCRPCAAATSSSSPRSTRSAVAASISWTDPRSGSTESSTQPATGSTSPTCPPRWCRQMVATCRSTGGSFVPGCPGSTSPDSSTRREDCCRWSRPKASGSPPPFTGQLRLPSQERMWQAIEQPEPRTRERFPDESPRSVRCDPHAYRRLLHADRRRARRTTLMRNGRVFGIANAVSLLKVHARARIADSA